LKEIYENDELWIFYGLKISGNPNDARELVQEMYIKVYDYLQKNPNSKIHKAFIFTVLRRLFLDWKRDCRIVYVDDEFLNVEQDTECIEILEKRKEVDRALDELRFIEWAVLLKTSETSLREIERESKVNYQQVHKYRKQALPKLKKILCQKRLKG
jgi:RNA polymerase sigma factor (sigma-70 family)